MLASRAFDEAPLGLERGQIQRRAVGLARFAEPAEFLQKAASRGMQQMILADLVRAPRVSR